ncbi:MULTISPECIES: acyl-CoA dehydrogenase [Phyllobacterium]|jgi:acyl-CoA dehydrogenase|uniref:3-methylmercaptopropionyl-CoA dehydrogenase n=1 Tax=Phyllobacterium sophorae TaxID=1520277 RepID=A0A2P7B493_9HYPH|nr:MULTISPECIES: acyl-CoA dehydrogenase [Phyllobacterium]PSH61276.1 acyl-CoA dehydrogenase [Phyllobacterium sophorae]UXN63329.1 acyl-CoA dehydrogenase [Phyllobacterium sp. A18/5-2]
MYRAPVEEIAHTLKVAGLERAIAQGRFGDLSDDLVDAILEEAGKFASTRVAPLLEIGDKHGTPLKDAAVTMPPGWKDVYHEWSSSGWNALTGKEEFGGQGLPMMLAIATFEMWNSGSMAFGIGPTLTLGAIEALDAHATDELKRTYLPKLVSGEWMGTMNLTEPQAGSDVGALRTRAERAEDGTYRIFGSKIFITYGEHDLTENIIHMVLARLPDAPAGTKGISLFLVPKFLVNADGSPGARNDVFCGGIEHKLGIHGSPTCTMIYGDGFAKDREPGAVGWLIGEENRGLACMFTMMNNARLAVGIQGVAVAEAAYQKSLAFAQERRQMRAPGWTGAGISPIIEHPDVQRNLLTMKGLTGAARSIAYACAHALDMAKTGSGDDARYWTDRANLLTPVAKAFSTDIGVDVASIGIQIHGGMGFIEETGAAQFLRDARIAPIYEGTNGIQAIDLVQRKLPLGGGDHIKGYIAELRIVADAVTALNSADFGDTGKRLQAALDALESTSAWLQQAIGKGEIREAYAGATPYLRLFGLAAGATYLTKGALGGENAGRIALARFFAENLLSETNGLKDRIIHGGASLLGARSALAS